MAIKDLKDNLKRLKDADPVELASQVNTWIQESGEALRLRIEDEVEKAVTKRGFVKRSEFSKLEARIAALEGSEVKRKSKVEAGTVKNARKGQRGKSDDKVSNKVSNKGSMRKSVKGFRVKGAKK